MIQIHYHASRVFKKMTVFVVIHHHYQAMIDAELSMQELMQWWLLPHRARRWYRFHGAQRSRHQSPELGDLGG